MLLLTLPLQLNGGAAYKSAALPVAGATSEWSDLKGQCSNSGAKAVRSVSGYFWTREGRSPQKEILQTPPPLPPQVSGAAVPKPREAALPTSHPRGYFYCTKRLLEAALAAAWVGETPLRLRGAPICGPT